MILTIYKSSHAKEPKIIGSISTKPNEVRISTNDKQLMRIIDNSLKTPVKIKIRGRRKIIKRKPDSMDEHIRASLKQRLHDPYWIGPKKVEIKDPKYDKVLGSLVLEKAMQ